MLLRFRRGELPSGCRYSSGGLALLYLQSARWRSFTKSCVSLIMHQNYRDKFLLGHYQVYTVTCDKLLAEVSVFMTCPQVLELYLGCMNLY